MLSNGLLCKYDKSYAVTFSENDMCYLVWGIWGYMCLFPITSSSLLFLL